MRKYLSNQTRRLLLCFLLFGSFAAANAQEVTVQGKVTDENQEPIPGVSILLKSTGIGTTTDVDGGYRLTIPQNVGNTLVFSFVGYQNQEVPVNGQTTLNVQLLPDVKALDEVVVVGYATQKKVSMVSAVSAVSSDELTQRTTKNLSSGLQGLAPGLTVLDRGGSPGNADFTMYIRGITSISGNQPLVIVDGLAMSLNDVDPNNVASVSVLKDAASTAIYGSRAANGVILITTKRGKEGDFKVNYGVSLDLQNLTVMPEHMGTEDYLRLQNVAYVNRGSLPLYSEEEIQHYVSGDDPLHYPLPNVFFDEVIQKNAPMQRHILSLSGGTEKMKTNVMLNYFDQKGIYPNQNSQRYALRMNNDFKVSDAVSFQADVQVQRKDRYTVRNEDDIYHRMLHSSQFVVPRYPDGSYGLSKQKHNPLAWTDPNIRGAIESTTDMGVINLQGSWRILKGLKLTSQYALDFSKHSSLTNIPTYEIVDQVTGVSSRNDINELTDYRSESLQKTWNNVLTYDLTKDAHAMSFMVGYSEISYDYKTLTANGRGFYNNDLRNLSQGDPLNRGVGANYEDWGLQSLFGRVNYAFDERYLFEANMRYDGSSIFPEGNRYAFFPSIAGAWRLSEEAFWEPLSTAIDQFKIRGSWGVTGNNRAGLYSYFNNLTLKNNYAFNGVPVTGVLQDDYASQDLTWENTTQTNIGMDLSVLGGKVNVTVDWFNKVTDDILLLLPIPATVGLAPQYTNAGAVQNRGWEFQLDHRNTVNDFTYGITLNLSDVKNKILDLAGTGPYLPGDDGWLARIEGQPIDALYGFKTDGLLTQEDFDNNYPVFASDAKPGDIKYIDISGPQGVPDGNITTDDRTVIGSTVPRLSYGMNLMLGWKNFDFNVQLQGLGNNDVGLYGALVESGSWEGFTLDMAKDYWTEDNPGAAFPRPQKQQKKNTRPSEWWMVNGAYLRVKNLQLGYTLPTEVVQKAGIDKLRLYVGGTNLFTVSELNKWGIDAEAATGRGVFYPATKTYTFGLNLSF